MAAGDAPRTLDIKEPQILRHYPADANAFYWHHRVLLVKVSPGIWIGLTPDGDLERINLHDVDHLPLERRSDFPGPQSPYIYAFDEISRQELERHKRRAHGMAALFNDTSADDIEIFEWMICDTTHSKFGEAVSDEHIDAGVTLGDSGVITLEGVEVFVRRVASSKKAEVILSLDKSRGDIRILGDHRDAQNKRFLDFKSAMALLKEESMSDWPLQGPRVALEMLRAVRSGPGDMTTYHLTWLKSSGVNIYSMVAHEHKIICNVIRNALEIDQLSVVNSLAFELLIRRLVQMETAVARNAQNPDFTGLDLMLEDSVGQGGEAITTTFNSWLSTKLKEKASIAKQTRLYKEEFRATASSSTAVPTDSSNQGRGDGPVRRGRGRGRGRAGSPASGAGAGGQS